MSRMSVKEKNDAQWREFILLSVVNIEAETDWKWSPVYFSAGWWVAVTVVEND